MEHGQHYVLYCATCERKQIHMAVFVAPHHWSEPVLDGEYALDHELENALLECQVCKSATLRTSRRTEQLSEEWKEIFFPPQPSREMPSWVDDLPVEQTQVRQLLNEVYRALSEGQTWLVAMGCGALIDMFVLARIGDVGGFKAKLDRLEKENYLSSKDRIVVEAALEVRHDATHRQYRPSVKDCERCLGITENLLHRLALDGDAAAIREQRVKRP